MGGYGPGTKAMQNQRFPEPKKYFAEKIFTKSSESKAPGVGSYGPGTKAMQNQKFPEPKNHFLCTPVVRP